jgi:hypothetical protein
MATTPSGAALLMARLRVVARRAAQQQQQRPRGLVGVGVRGGASLSSSMMPGAAAVAAPAAWSISSARPPLVPPSSFSAAMSTMSTATAAHDGDETTPSETSPPLPPGASPLLPVAAADAAATALSRAGAFSSPPRPLTFDRGVYRYPDTLEGNAFGRAILRLTGSYSRRQTLRNGAVVLWDAISELGGDRDPALARAFGLDPRAFMTTWYLQSLGVWLVINRLKLEGAAEAADFQQHLYSHLYQPDVARRVRAVPGVVPAYSGKWLRRLEQVFYGMALAYDRAIVGGDGVGPGAAEPSGVGGGGVRPAAAAGAAAASPAPPSSSAEGHGARAALARALVRNVYGGDGAYAASADLLAGYLCRQLQCLAMTPTEDLYLGQVRFGGLEAGGGLRGGGEAAKARAEGPRA